MLMGVDKRVQQYKIPQEEQNRVGVCLFLVTFAVYWQSLKHIPTGTVSTCLYAT